MALRVDISDRARAQLDEMTAWWAKNRSAEQAERWYDGFARAILGLSTTYQDCPLAAENRDWPFELRELRFGLGRKPTHRALLTVRPECVYVFADPTSGSGRGEAR